MSVVERPLVGTGLAEPHHDGSEAYVLERPEELGGEAVVRLRVPDGTPAERVVLRYVRDGEPRSILAEVDERREGETWWRATFPVANPQTRYRWLLGANGTHTWLNGLGPSSADVADADDYVMTAGDTGPDWHLGSVVYEIFPDRFASSGLDVEPPPWAVRREWDALPEGRSADTPFEWFGGDLRGIEQRLDYVEDLGANVIYLTPFFPAGSTHRYDASTFDRVDPMLGGDEALASLVAVAHARGMRVVADLTLNHTGDGHEWFRAAHASSQAPERDFYVFDDSLPSGYEAWWGIPSLPKLDWRSAELRRRLLDGPDAVLRRWTAPPFDLDGWRIDVANMAGRLHDVDVSAELARRTRQALTAARPDALLVAEHGYDFRADLQGDGWHGVMNYAGFQRPVCEWLRGDELPEELVKSFWGMPIGLRSAGGAQVVAAMRLLRAGVPWDVVVHSWTLLDSHDSARFRTVAGSRERQLVGVGLQMTTPGVPMVFAGDELGLEGDWGEDARRTMPWSRPDTWDTALLSEYRRLAALRRSSEALARGGIRYAHVSDDAIAYLRESPRERVLCLASRAAHDPIHLPLDLLGARELERVYGGEATIAGGEAVLPGDGPAFHAWRLRNG